MSLSSNSFIILGARCFSNSNNISAKYSSSDCCIKCSVNDEHFNSLVIALSIISMPHSGMHSLSNPVILWFCINDMTWFLIPNIFNGIFPLAIFLIISINSILAFWKSSFYSLIINSFNNCIILLQLTLLVIKYFTSLVIYVKFNDSNSTISVLLSTLE